MNETTLTVDSDGSALAGGACLVDEPRGMVVLLHGIPSINPPEPGDTGYAGFARRVAERGFSAVWADMRGVRGSEGFFSIEGWVRDAIAIVRAARDLQEAPFLALVGSSAGGAVSVEAARRGAEVDAVGLLAAPAAWMSFAADHQAGIARVTEEAGMPLAPDVLNDPTEWAAEFDAVAAELAAPDVRVPLLVVHGTADTVVPVDNAQRIGDAAPNAEVRIIEGAEHQLRRDERALDILFEWLDRISP